jgi:hypothetical protein
MSTIVPSLAGALYKMILDAPDRSTYLKSFLMKTPPLGEAEFLDYKAAADSNFTKVKALEIWSEYLSAFGNSGGGVLIFGFYANKNIPTGLSLVPDAIDLRTYLLEKQPLATEPPVSGVDVIAIPNASDSNAGFLVCFIPPSPWRPHRVRTPGGNPARDQYYMRIGDNNHIASHSILKNLFQPSRVAQLEITARTWMRRPASCKQINMALDEVTFSVWLHNHGPATARSAYVVTKSDSIGSCGFDKSAWVKCAEGGKTIAVRTEHPIHPTANLKLFGGGLSVLREDTKWDFPPPFTFEITVYVEDQMPTVFSLEISEADVRNATADAGRNIRAISKPTI